MVAKRQSKVTAIAPFPQGRHERVRAGNIQVDPSYQRHLSPGRVERIAAHWVHTVPIEVSQRTDGSGLYVYNGMHRLEAFKRRFGSDAEIDCWIEELSRDEEARRFANQYVNATRVPPYNVLRAMASTGDEHATGVLALMEKFGLKPTQNIQAITTFSILYRKDALSLEIALGIMREAWGRWEHHRDEPTGMIYAGLFDLIHYHGHEIERSRVVDVLSRMPVRTLILRALAMAPGTTRLQEHNVYELLVDLYNGQRRKEGTYQRIKPDVFPATVHRHRYPQAI